MNWCIKGKEKEYMQIMGNELEKRFNHKSITEGLTVSLEQIIEALKPKNTIIYCNPEDKEELNKVINEYNTKGFEVVTTSYIKKGKVFIVDEDKLKGGINNGR